MGGLHYLMSMPCHGLPLIICRAPPFTAFSPFHGPQVLRGPIAVFPAFYRALLNGRPEDYLISPLPTCRGLICIIGTQGIIVSSQGGNDFVKREFVMRYKREKVTPDLRLIVNNH